MSVNNGDTFLGFAGFLGLSALLCFPVLGWTGIMAALATMYFGLVLTNGAGKAHKRKTRDRGGK
jgi:hypothetical protein